MHRTAAAIVGTVLSLYFSFCSWSSHEMETCTMGDTDGYMVALLFGGPVALVAMALLWRSRNARTAVVYVGATLVVVVSGALLALDLVPWVIATTLSGNHPCGAEYNSYLLYLGSFRQYIPAAHAVLVAAIFGFACVPILSAARRAA